MCYDIGMRSDIWVYLVLWMPLAYDHFEYCYCPRVSGYCIHISGMLYFVLDFTIN